MSLLRDAECERPVLIARLPLVCCRPGEKYQELTWATHPWVVRDRITEESLLVCYGPGAVTLPIATALMWCPCVCS